MAEKRVHHFLVNLYIFSWISYFNIYMYVVEGSCSGRFGTDPSCSRPCRCADNSDCDTQTGDCGTSGCGAGRPHGYRWGGPACQIGNVAYGFKEHTNQTGTYDRHTSDLALDGRLATSGDYYCAVPLNPAGRSAGEPAEWTVDLRRNHKIYNVTLYAGYSYSNGADRMTNFEINVISSSGTRSLCANYTDPAPPGRGNVTLTCCPPLVGQYVHFIRTGEPRIDIATLCEVVATGHLFTDCNAISCPDHCDEITGCSQCPAGKLLPECTDDCPSGKYGVGCNQDCGHCKEASGQCDPVDGSCTEGCEMWYAEDSCRTFIREDHYNNEYLRVNVTTYYSVTLHWEQQPNMDNTAVQAQYYGYIVQYKESSSNSYINYTDVKHDPQNTHRTTVVSGLKYNTEYDFRIRIYREWEGVKYAATYNYPTVWKRTLCKAPGSPMITYVEETMSASRTSVGEIKISIQLPSESGCEDIIQRWLEYRMTSINSWKHVILSESATSHILQVLPGTYDLRITVTNNQNINSSSVKRKATVLDPKSDPPNEPTVEFLPGKSVDDQNDNPGGNLPIIVGLVVPLVILAAILILLLIVLRRRGVEICHDRQARQSDEDHNNSLGHENTMYYTSIEQPSLRSVPEDHTKEENLYERILERGGSVSVTDLESYFTNVIRSLQDEHKRFPAEDRNNCKVAKSGCEEIDKNKLKNRFREILAYDHSRVVLDIIDRDTTTDYINANYIDGHQHPKSYIATQGPLPDTMYDFWRMIWLVKANRIVMVTNLVEKTKRKCDQYWPSAVGGTVAHGVFTVTMDAEEVLADFTLRILSVKKGTLSRTVHQFHFTSWEDKKQPINGAWPVLCFRRRVHSFDGMAEGPMVVHCSDGVGRTGTFLAIDFLLGQAKTEHQVNFYSCVENMRRNRMKIVQTDDEYVFLHEVVLEALRVGDVSYPCHGFQHKFNELCQHNRVLGKIPEMQRQFQLLDDLKTKQVSKKKDGLNDANKDKNRDFDIVPADTDRVYMPSRPGRYINAVKVNGFKTHDSYIATQMPFPHTIGDFWLLIYDVNVHTIVLLDEINHAEESCPQYWPIEVGQSKTYGQINVHFLSEKPETKSKSVVVREFRISCLLDEYANSEMDTTVKTIRQYQLRGWGQDEEFPTDMSILLDLQQAVEDYDMQIKEANNGKTLIQCINGATRTGIFCALTHVLEQMKVDQEIDVFTAVRYVANRRPQFIDTLDQYKCIYQLAIEYMTKFAAYSNFR